MKKNQRLTRLTTGVTNLDAVLHGGLPTASVVVFAGPPGAGKTILAQQICFHHASSDNRALYLSTLSEPTAKTLRYMSQFDFFDRKKLDDGVRFIDLGVILRSQGLEETSKLVMEQVKKVKPAIVVIDSFKAFDDLARSQAELRKFSYELAVNLMAWESTVLLLGEYGNDEIQTNPIFSVVDGLITLTQREQSGEQQRFMQVRKMRGTGHSADEQAFVIRPSGIEVFAPRVVIARKSAAPAEPRCKTGISRLDDLLGDGIPRGSSLLISGVAGTGKTLLLLEFVYRGAQAGEKGILFSFEETRERLLATSRGLGWDVEREIKRGMLDIVFVPQPDIEVEGHVLMMKARIEAMGARRIAIDSISVFLHKVHDPAISRDKIFQIASVVQNAQAVAFLATDIPYGTNQISRFGVEETVVDGVMLLSSIEEGLERMRYLEVYKLRNTAHLKGRHNLAIEHGGLKIFPRYNADEQADLPPVPIKATRRLETGVPGLDALLGGGLLERSATLVSGSAGIGKTTLALQFLAQGAKRKEPGLYVGLEESPQQVLESANVLELGMAKAVKSQLVEIIYLSSERVRANQFLAILADKIRANGVRRLVLDSASHLVPGASMETDLKPLLSTLVSRFKALGVTSLLTLEASAMSSLESATERGLSPVTDNLLMLRYSRTPAELTPTLTVIKTRGSNHDRRTYSVAIGKGGMRIETAVGAAASVERALGSAKKPRRKAARKRAGR